MPSGGFLADAGALSCDQTATMLPSGTILLAGGYITVALPNGTTETNITNTAEVFHPASRTFTSLLPNTMTAAGRNGHKATLLPSGKVLLEEGKPFVLEYVNVARFGDDQILSETYYWDNQTFLTQLGLA